MKTPTRLPPNPPTLTLTGYQRIILKACPPHRSFSAADIAAVSSGTAGFPPISAIRQHFVALVNKGLIARVTQGSRFYGPSNYVLTDQGRRQRTLLLKKEPT